MYKKIKSVLLEFQSEVDLFQCLWKPPSNFEPYVLRKAASLVHHLHTPVCSQSATDGINDCTLKQLLE